MRLKSVYISNYKNLKDFSLDFDSDSFIDVFVGKNGTGKSNLFEALILIFQHIDEFDRTRQEIDFDYRIKFSIYDTGSTESGDANELTEIAWISDQLIINGKGRKTIGKTPLPDNVLVYYSGHNETVSQLVEQYEEAFAKRIKSANPDESRRFIGVGPEYKGLLLSLLLMQPAESRAREFVCSKLGIESTGAEVRLRLERPFYAKGPQESTDLFDETNRFWAPKGNTKEFLNRLAKCISTADDGPVRAEGYFAGDDYYILYFDIAKIQEEFKELSPQGLFRQFDNLKTLEMLGQISVAATLNNGEDVNLSQLSDGQFQSVYIYSIVELFRDRNCITLLDEPDAFLHPEWQFEFLKQVFEITEAATKNNHVLMSSHSAATLSTANDRFINLFDFDEGNVVVTKSKKADVIRLLSAGVISFSESEARLNIRHVLKNTSGAVLFTEGITDEIILEHAYAKLYPGQDRCFEIQNAFSCSFLRILMRDEALYRTYPTRSFFALFDFDEAYGDWNQLGQDIETDPCKCLTKKHRHYESYALLLPVPASGQIRSQVINSETGRHFGNLSLLTIELMFFGNPGLGRYFVDDTDRPGGFVKFVGDSQKVHFARDVVPSLGADCFEVFRPIFEFMKSKCPTT